MSRKVLSISLVIFFWVLTGILFGLNLKLMIWTDISDKEEFMIIIRQVVLVIFLSILGAMLLRGFLFKLISILIIIFYSNTIVSSVLKKGMNAISYAIYDIANYYQTDYIWSWIFGVLGGLVGISMIWFVRKEKSQQTGEW